MPKIPKVGNSLPRNVSRFSGIVWPPKECIDLPTVVYIPNKINNDEVIRIRKNMFLDGSPKIFKHNKAADKALT